MAVALQIPTDEIMLKLTKIKQIVLLCLTAPLLSFVLISPDWLARFVADTLYCLVITTLVFIAGLHPKSKVIGSGGYFAVHKSSEQTKRRASFIVRGLIVAFGCVCLYANYLQFYDVIQVAQHGASYLLKCEAKVTNNDSLYGIYMAEQSVSIEWNEGVQVFRNTFAASLFPRRARPGNTYYFIIAPKSGQILDFKETPIYEQ